MTIEPELLSLLAQNVTLEPAADLDERGERSYGPAGQRRARVEATSRRVFLPDRSETVATSVVYMEGPVPSVLDRITLPDGSQPRILQVKAQPDENGELHHVEVLV